MKVGYSFDGVAKMMERACVLCNNCTDDILQFGEKNTYEDTTAHLYCLVSTFWHEQFRLFKCIYFEEATTIFHTILVQRCRLRYIFTTVGCSQNEFPCLILLQFKCNVFLLKYVISKKTCWLNIWSFQLLTSNLVQNGDDDEGISGFMPKDIKAEVSRTKKLVSLFNSKHINCLMWGHSFVSSYVIIVKERVQQLVAAWNRAGDHFICRVVWKMIVALNLQTHFGRFAIYIMILRNQKMLINQPICAQFAMMKWARTIQFDQFRCRAAIRMHGATSFAYKNMPKLLAIFWSVRFATIRIIFENSFPDEAFSFQTGKGIFHISINFRYHKRIY